MSANSSISTSEPRPIVRSGFFFVLAAIGIALLLLAAVALLNWEVDPFDKLGHNLIGVYNSSERDAKPQMLVRYPHDGLILGSSRMTFIDPRTIRGYRFFDGAFSDAMPEEMLDFFRVYATNEKLVVIGLDFQMFNETYAPIRPDRFKPIAPPDATPNFWQLIESSDLRDYLLSWNVTWNSAKALAENLIGINPPFLMPAGNRNARKRLAEDARVTTPDDGDSIEYWRTHLLYNFRYSAARLAILQQIKELLQDRHTALIVLTTPDNTSFVALIHEMGLYELYLLYRQDIRKIFPDAFDFSESRWSALVYRFKNDPGHFLPQTGTEMMQEVLAAHVKLERREKVRQGAR